MKQLVQGLNQAGVVTLDVPAPRVKAGHLLIRTRASIISPGTERMLVQFGRAGFLQKARMQPEKVRQVLTKVRSDGLAATLSSVQAKLQQAVPLGYSQVGDVVAVGEKVNGFHVGDRVVSNGPHAEYAMVAVNLCARVPVGPDVLPDEAAAFTVLGAIALQGVRLASPTLGETFAVFGLGLLGLLTVQLLHSNGCRVIALDFDTERLDLAARFGAHTVDLKKVSDPVNTVGEMLQGSGVDGALLTLSSASSLPVHQAAQMCRKRGRIVLVGVTGLQLQRADFYEKELSFQVSCSYGPGRYDPQYEKAGHDYPLAFVRWTEQRNFEAVLNLLASGRLNVAPLISERVPFEQAGHVYENLAGAKGPLGVVLQYQAPKSPLAQPAHTLIGPTVRNPARAPQGSRVAVLGTGQFACQVLLPALHTAGAQLEWLVSDSGTSAAWAAWRWGARRVSTAISDMLADPGVGAVVIATRHDSHAALVTQALRAGKAVFVEKPLALSLEELREVETAYRAANGHALLAVGFNRRFAPQVQRMKGLLQGIPGAKTIVITVNAGHLPAHHWLLDHNIGGGRLIGEGCHFIDLLRHLVGAPISRWQRLGGASENQDFALHLQFTDGSSGTVHYVASGHRAFPKERIEVFAGGRVLQLDNFRTLKGYGFPAFRSQRRWRQDKGHQANITAFLAAATGHSAAPIPFEELLEVHRVTLAAHAGEQGTL